MSIVIVTALAVILAFFIAKSIYVSSKPKETTTPTPSVESTVHIEHQIPPYIPTPRVEEEPVVIENKISTPVVLGSDDVPTKPKPKKKPAAKMSAAPKKAPKKKSTDA